MPALRYNFIPEHRFVENAHYKPRNFKLPNMNIIVFTVKNRREIDRFSLPEERMFIVIKWSDGLPRILRYRFQWEICLKKRLRIEKSYQNSANCPLSRKVAFHGKADSPTKENDSVKTNLRKKEGKESRSKFSFNTTNASYQPRKTANQEIMNLA